MERRSQKKMTARTWKVITILLLAEGILALAVVIAPSQPAPVLITEQDPECPESCMPFVSTSWTETNPLRQNLVSLAGVLFLILTVALVAATWRKPLHEELDLRRPDSQKALSFLRNHCKRH